MIVHQLLLTILSPLIVLVFAMLIAAVASAGVVLVTLTQLILRRLSTNEVAGSSAFTSY